MKIYDSLNSIPEVPGRYGARLPVTTEMNGMEVVVWVHALVGADPGPTLTLLGGLHGNEWLHLEFFRRFIRDFDETQVRGRVLAIPVANVVAFGSLSRNTPGDADNADANRSFPGTGRNFTWVSEQIATAIAEEVFPVTTHLLDFHLGVWGHTMASSIVGTDYSDPEVNRKSLDLAFAFGTPLIFGARMISHWPGPRSSTSYAGEVLGVPGCASMLGGAGFDRDLEKSWLKANLRGIQNVMVHLEMLDGQVQLPDRYLVYETVQRVNPRAGGLLLPVNEVETFGREVARGETLGRVVSPLTFEILEELKAPVDGYLMYWARTYPIGPGEWAYGVIPGEHSGTRWVSGPDL